MRYIIKGHEPAELTRQRTTEGSSYAAFEDLRIALAKEQGYICAFCMRRLDLAARDEQRERMVVVAHLLSRHPASDNGALREERRLLGMSYRNLVLACNGRTGDTIHCDKQQGNADVTIPLFNRAEMEHITFSIRGEIRHPKFQDQIGKDDKHKGILNLNATALVSRRRQRWLTVAKVLNKAGRWKEGELEKQLQSWAEVDANGHLREDCQCVIFILREKLRQLQSQPKKPQRKK